MADMNFTTRERGRSGKYRPHRIATRIDMTPMVDLGFLLITFFILTTTLVKMNTLPITVPNTKGGQDVRNSDAVTILLDKNNNLYYYFGTKDKKGTDPVIVKTNYTANGIRQMLLTRNIYVNNQIRILKSKYESGQLPEKAYLAEVKKAQELKTAPVVMIKATDEATYNNVVDILDEMKICNIGKYSLLNITPYDKDLIAKKSKTS
jgi:biopolymer transport protein ExbD